MGAIRVNLTALQFSLMYSLLVAISEAWVSPISNLAREGADL